MENSGFSQFSVVLNTFFICVVVYFLEYKFLYYKVISLFGSTIISKVFTILAVFIALYFLRLKPSNIGFIKKSKEIVTGIALPIIILGICTLISLLLLRLFVSSQGFELDISFKVSSTGFGESTVISYIIAILVAIISALMLEVLLRGLIFRIADVQFESIVSHSLNVILTILWHSLIYLFSLIFTNMSMTTFWISIVFTCIIYGIGAIRNAIYISTTNSIWYCIVDSFISLFVIRGLSIMVSLPTDFIPTSKAEHIILLLSSNSINSSYFTLTFICAVNILSLIFIAVYCRVIENRARARYIKQMKENEI